MLNIAMILTLLKMWKIRKEDEMSFRRIVLRNLERRGEARRIEHYSRIGMKSFLMKYTLANFCPDKYGQLRAITWEILK